MKCVLIGYPGSQRIVKASKYLTEKYLPFDMTYLNYRGPVKGWGAYVSGFLRYLTDDNVIFALDDYLVAGFDEEKYKAAQAEIGGSVACVKLCKSTEQEHLEYPVTTQYTIWNREFLIWLLRQIETPWEFEIQGSVIFRSHKEVILRTCIDYNCNSSISAKWEGVDLLGVKKEDITYLTEHELI